MSLSTPIGSVSLSQAKPATHHHRRPDADFARNLAVAGASRPVGSGGPGALLSSSLLQQIQSLTGTSGSTPGPA